jgi:hypothetical protein
VLDNILALLWRERIEVRVVRRFALTLVLSRDGRGKVMYGPIIYCVQEILSPVII